MPALLKRMSIEPNLLAVVTMRRFASGARETSVLTKIASPSLFLISRTVSWPARVSTSASTTCAPFCANNIAAARPIPEPPPVTTAVRPTMPALLTIDLASNLNRLEYHQGFARSNQHRNNPHHPVAPFLDCLPRSSHTSRSLVIRVLRIFSPFASVACVESPTTPDCEISSIMSIGGLTNPPLKVASYFACLDQA